MDVYYYLSLIPESLIASMLPPDEFGNYFALGSHKRSRGQAAFFEVDPEAAGDAIDRADAERRCVPHENGAPRKSSYLQIYRVLEAIPTGALVRLHLTTDDGRTLPIESAECPPEEEDRLLHLYQEICPVTPRVVSKLPPRRFCESLTASDTPIHVPRLVFAEMKLGDLATNPDSASTGNLPYVNLEHLRDCLRELRNAHAKPNKTVLRQMKQDVLFRTIRGGFYAGDADGVRYFPLPELEELETTHYAWWRSALSGYGA